jgi:hypothetical protein
MTLITPVRHKGKGSPGDLNLDESMTKLIAAIKGALAGADPRNPTETDGESQSIEGYAIKSAE